MLPEPVIHPGGLVIVDYIPGTDRSDYADKVRSHTYAVTNDGDYIPMCEYGWNRSDGERLSIWRGHVSARGHCKICDRREATNAHPILEARGHKTRYL